MSDEVGSLLLNLTTAPERSGVHRVKISADERRIKSQTRLAVKEAKRLAKKRLKAKKKKSRPGNGAKGKNSAPAGERNTAAAAPLTGKANKQNRIVSRPGVKKPGQISSGGSTDGKKPATIFLPSVLRKPKPKIAPGFVTKPGKKKTVRFSLGVSGNNEKKADGRRTAGKFVVKGNDASQFRATRGVLPLSAPAVAEGDFASFVKKKKFQKGSLGVPKEVKQADGTVRMVKEKAPEKVASQSTPTVAAVEFASFVKKKKSPKAQVGVPLKVKLPDGTVTRVKEKAAEKMPSPSASAATGGGFASFAKKTTPEGRVGAKVKQAGGAVATVTRRSTSQGPLQKFRGTKANEQELGVPEPAKSEGSGSPLRRSPGKEQVGEPVKPTGAAPEKFRGRKQESGLGKPGTVSFERSQPQGKGSKRPWAEANKDSGYEEDASEEEPRPWKRGKGGPAGTEGDRESRGRVTSLFGNNPEIPQVAHRVVKPLKEKVFADQQFSDVPIHEYQVSNLRSMGLTRLTEVQRRAVPVLLEGRDALVRSQTGSGKTLAYALPLVELLQRQRPPLTRADGVRAVVVLPTRELALQTYEVFCKLVKPFVRLVPGILAGGEKRKAEKVRLRKGISILVGTPGRLVDHVNHTRALRLDKVQFLVLDEADRLLDMGYEKDISSLVSALDSQSGPLLSAEVLAWNRSSYNKAEQSQVDYDNDKNEEARVNKIIKFSDSEDEEGTPTGKITKSADSSEEEEEKNYTQKKGKAKKSENWAEEGDTPGEAGSEKDESKGSKKKTRQTVLLSATLTPGVERLAGLALHSHVYIDAADADATAAEIVIPAGLQQYYMIVPAKLRLVTLSAFIIAKCKMSNQRKILLFCGTQDMVDYLSALLSAVLGRGADLDDAKKAAAKESDGEEESGSDSELDPRLLAAMRAATRAEEEEGPAIDVEFFRLHGSMDQKERTHVFQTFREAKNGVLLCTDVAARGLDLPRVDWIVQWTAPCSVADYVHRVGRTARGGAPGHALLFLCPHETPFLAMLQERRIRLEEEKLERCLLKLARAQNSTSPEGAATGLQTRFENAVLEHPKLRNHAVKAYVSYVRFYAAYPRDVREAFNFKGLHLGHHAKSFALRDPPSAIAGHSRRQHQRDEKRLQHRGPAGGKAGARAAEGGRPKGMHGAKESAHKAKARLRTRDLVLSEFSSGLEPLKKKKKFR